MEREQKKRCRQNKHLLMLFLKYMQACANFEWCLRKVAKCWALDPPKANFVLPRQLLDSRVIFLVKTAAFFMTDTFRLFFFSDDSLMIYGLKCGCSKKKRDENFGSATLYGVYLVPNFAVRSQPKISWAPKKFPLLNSKLHEGSSVLGNDGGGLSILIVRMKIETNNRILSAKKKFSKKIAKRFFVAFRIYGLVCSFLDYSQIQHFGESCPNSP